MSCVKRLTSWLAALFMLLVFSSQVQAVERVTYYHTNALGSPVAATDASGELLWREAYTPFGERLLKEDTTGEEVWYTGKQEESTYGVSYFGARWYDPELGRFLAIDPVGVDVRNLHSFNRYVYVNNNPYKFIDPDGRIATWLNGHKKGMPLNTAVQAGAVGNGIAGAAASPYIIASTFVAGPESLGGGIAAGTARFVPKKAVTDLVPKGTAKALRPVGSVLESVNDVLINPRLLSGKTPAQVQAIIGKTPGWKIETLGKGSKKGQGWVFRQYNNNGQSTGQSLRWHPGGGHHGPDPYWRVTSNAVGKSDIIR